MLALSLVGAPNRRIARVCRMDGHHKELGEALNLMVRALALLDKTEGAHEAGAHLDLAICRLRALHSIDKAPTGERGGTSTAKKRSPIS